MICSLRRSFPFLGKTKLAWMLKDCGIHVSASTVQRTIHRFDLPSAPRQYVARKKAKKKPRLPRDHIADHPGDLVSLDGIVLQEAGQKKYIITALDHATRIAIARVYGALSSRSARDLLERMRLALGTPIQAVLTDNGSEFHATFEQACTEEPVIQHYWTYPRSPKMNARTERFNRTIQEEAVFPLFSESLDSWNAWIGHYIMVYNFFRPHQALAYKRPIDQYLSCLSLPEGKSRMWWTHTYRRFSTSTERNI
ncbi:transposase [Candidatus Peregrinibacteria bacterium]|nr:transposase [Candidatus Peregrinibacteria bacterium]